jgi:hypothetical protein
LTQWLGVWVRIIARRAPGPTTLWPCCNGVRCALALTKTVLGTPALLPLVVTHRSVA